MTAFTNNRVADFAVFDAGDIYTGGYHYQLIPIMSEIYNTRSMELGQPEYYAVAVAYQGDPDTELTYLKGLLSSLAIDLRLKKITNLR